MSALKTGATGLYVDENENTFAVLVIGPHFEVKSPGKDKRGNDLPPARVPVEGEVRVRLFDEHGNSYGATISEDAIVPAAADFKGSV